MRLDVSIKKEHADIATAVAWAPDNQLISCSDDKVLIRWTSDAEVAGKVGTIGAFITGIAWFPVIGKQAPDTFVISCTDGTYRFVSRSGREEKKVQAHEGAVILVTWSRDGSTLLSGGEDGDVKIWSKSGNLRSTLASTGQSVYCACWGPDDDQICIGNGKILMIKTVQANRKNLQWNAHEGLVLCVDWNVANNMIVSGGEDCIYRVWDAFGRQLFASKVMEHVVTSIAWSPNGQCFAVGSHDMLRLCDKAGWTYCRERVSTGSMMCITWTPDGTQFAGATGSGAIVFAQVVDRRVEWKNTEVTVTGQRKLRIQDTFTETLQDIELSRDRIVEVGLGFDHLIVTTTSQCSIYTLTNLNTPIIIDIRAPPHFMHLCNRHLLTSDHISGLQVISYEGKILSSPRFQGLRPEYLTRDTVALSPDTVAVVDTVDSKNIHIMDAMNGRVQGKLVHALEVVEVCLNQHTISLERLLAFADRSKDLIVAQVVTGGAVNTSGILAFPTHKLISHIGSFVFHDETDVLVGLADGRLNTWYHPACAFVDKDLLSLTTTVTDGTELGRHAQITNYTGTRVAIRKADGSSVFISTPIDVEILYQLTRTSKWEEALRLCRHQRSPPLWATLAVMALPKKQLDIAEISLAEIDEVARVEYIQYIKDIPSEEGRLAELALFRRHPEEAERILLQATPPLIYRAIEINIRLFRWDRALEIAVKFKSHIDTVLGFRQKYLEGFNKTETNPRFLQNSSLKIDWEVIEAKIEKEREDEKVRMSSLDRKGGDDSSRGGGERKSRK
eukprot:CAMPEP_0182436838 /NCGR_PEP_ID=MMETSP1167-20130531/83886_1 /TAXON_ID=2988 /ORGANISM="Mallomonas Sp, Strain CCMP3275" /LENGTH=784 /DNA_ID=CAMNT_0024629435 /DNA_START=43 /DNA_END=2397 /DNA_ORIENTATION=+